MTEVGAAKLPRLLGGASTTYKPDPQDFPEKPFQSGERATTLVVGLRGEVSPRRLKSFFRARHRGLRTDEMPKAVKEARRREAELPAEDVEVNGRTRQAVVRLAPTTRRTRDAAVAVVLH
jgi:hypothetical protein